MQSSHSRDHVGSHRHGQKFSDPCPEGIHEIVQMGVMTRFVLVSRYKFDAVGGEGALAIVGSGGLEHPCMIAGAIAWVFVATHEEEDMEWIQSVVTLRHGFGNWE